MPFLIDGHNVIAALDDIDLTDPHDEAKLVLRLRVWAARANRKAIVVFDGGLPGGPSRTLSTVDVKVIFAARHHTNADRVIHERVRALPDAGNWTIVSSDREVRDQARDNGARVLTAQEFVELMERPTGPEKEKPDGISAAEVASWLEVFTEIEEEAVSPEEAGSSPASRTATTRAKAKARRSPQPPPDPAESRHSRSIGEQLGIEMQPAPPPPKPAGKPSEVSDAEVEAWLDVFHDDPESHIPPPRLPKKPATQPKRPEGPVVRKDGSLSESEVDTWLSVFEARPAAEPSSRADAGSSKSEGKKTGDAAERASKAKGHKVSPKLAKHRENAAPGAQDTTGLSQEDLELWHRLYGDEE